MNTPRLAVLGDRAMDRIHDASLELLRTVGVKVPHAEMRRLFREAGAAVDEATEVVKIPERLVMRCLDSAGRTFTLYGRDVNKQARYGMGTRNYNSAATEPFWMDSTCKQRRLTTLDDVATGTRLGDALPQINFVGAMADAAEVPAPYRCVAIAAAQLKNTTKPIHFFFHDRASARFVLELFTAVRGSEEAAARYPFNYPYLEPISPLRFPYHGIDILFETSRLDVPVLTGPMAQENAEILAGVCIIQLIKPGLPVCYGSIPHAFDMRTTQLIFAGPEQALLAVAHTQLGKRYGLPVYINVGLTDSKLPDAQAGLESGITLVCGAMAGADIFGHLGICGVDQGASLEILMMQHEIVAYVERVMRGFSVDEETLGLDVVRSVGHEGTFLGEPHTVRHFRSELWFPRLLDREFWSNWVAKGASSMHERCTAMIEQTLQAHTPEPLDEDVATELNRIVDAAKRHLTGG